MEKEVAGTKAKVEMLEKHLNKVETRIEGKVDEVSKKQDGLATDFAELKTVVVTAIATARVKWNVLFKVAGLVGVVAAIVAAIVKFVMMK